MRPSRVFWSCLFRVVLGLAFLCPLSGLPQSQDQYVRPIDWSRFAGIRGVSSNDALGLKIVTMFQEESHHELIWLHTHQIVQLPECNNIDCYYPFFAGNSDEIAIRGMAALAWGWAAMLQTGTFSESAAGVTEAEFLYRTVLTIRGVAGTHLLNKSSGYVWGDDWQSAYWAAICAEAAWMIWTNLDQETQLIVGKMMEHEADRFIGYVTPYWASPTGQILTPGDTKAEENAWNSKMLMVACCMMPTHPHRPLWKAKALELMVSSYARQADLTNTNFVDGKPVKDWLNGYNSFNDGVVVNHDRAHPGYIGSHTLNYGAALDCSFIGESIPQSVFFNDDYTWKAYTEVNFVTGSNPYGTTPIIAPGGTILHLKQGVPDSEMYFPNGDDWAPHEWDSTLLNLYTAMRGLDATQAISAVQWTQTQLDKLYELQHRAGHDGNIFQNGDWNVPDFERMETGMLQELVEDWLVWWLKQHNLVSPIAAASDALLAGGSATWTGGDPLQSPNWTRSSNWLGSVTPTSTLTRYYGNTNSGTVFFTNAPANSLSVADLPWQVGQLWFGAGVTIGLSGADLILDQGSNLTDTRGANIVATNGTVNITNKLLFSDVAYLANNTYNRHNLFVDGGSTLNLYGMLTCADANTSLYFRGDNGTYNVFGPLSVAGTINKSDASTLIFYNANSAWGTLNLNLGTVRLGAPNALAANGTFTFGQNTSATLDLNNFNVTVTGINDAVQAATGQTHFIITRNSPGGVLTLNDNGITNDWSSVVMSGAGGLVKNGTGQLILENSNHTYTGGTTINQGVLSLGNGGTGGGIVGNISNNATLLVNKSDNLTLAGNLTGTGALQKQGAGTLVLAGINSYTGPTVVSAGTLQMASGSVPVNSTSFTLSNSAAILDATPAGGLPLAAGQTLAGNGVVKGDLLAAAGSLIAPGNGIGTLSLSNHAVFTDSVLNFQLSANPAVVGGGVNDLVVVRSNVMLTGVTAVKIIPTATLNTAMPYTLLIYGGTLTGGAANLRVFSDQRYDFTVVDPTTTPGAIKVIVSGTGAAASLLWKGGAALNPTTWDLHGATNWLNGGNPDAFYLGDAVTFDDTAQTNAATLVGALQPASLTLSNNSKAYLFNGSGSLTAGGPLTARGNGSVSFSNASANAFTGVTVTGGGSVTMGNNGPVSLGNISLNNGSLTLANPAPATFTALSVSNGTMAFRQPLDATLAFPVTGNGTVAQQGSGTLSLAVNNAGFTGAFQVNNGVLRVGTSNSLVGSGVTVSGSGTLDVNGIATASTLPATISGAGVNGRGAIDNGSPTYQGYALQNLALAGDATIGASVGGWETLPSASGYAGFFAGHGFKLTKVGPMDLWLGNGNDTDLGDIDIKEGMLGFESNASGTALMGRSANTLTVRSNATLGFWSTATVGSKQIVLENTAALFSGATGSRFGGKVTLNGTNHVRFNTSSSVLQSDAVITGNGGLAVDSPGTLILNAANAHRGGTVMNAGVLRLLNNLSLSNNQSVVIKPASTTGGVIATTIPRLELSAGVIVPAGVTAYFQTDASGGYRSTFSVKDSSCQWLGPIVLMNNDVVNFNVVSGATFTIGGPVGNTNFTGTLCIRGAGTGILNGRVSIGGDLVKTDGSTWTITSISNQWNTTALAVGTIVLGANDALCVTAPFELGQGDANASRLDLNGRNQTVPGLVSLGGTGARQIGNGSTTADSVLTFNGGTNVSAFDGQILNVLGSGTRKVLLTIQSGTLQLNGNNTFTGPTAVKSGGTLGGTGTLTSRVTVENGGTLSPGASIGTLTVNSNLILNAGSVSCFEVTHSPLAGDKVTGLISVTYGGTLIVTNIGGTPLAVGDSFQLFSAASYSGSFASIQPPTPGSGLAWNISNLNVNGAISVVAVTPPNVDAVSRSLDGNLKLTVSGTVGVGYSIRATTNIAMPLGNWPVLNSGIISTSPFSYTDLTSTNFAQRFYRVSIP